MLDNIGFIDIDMQPANHFFLYFFEILVVSHAMDTQIFIFLALM